jgi:hypothetical protein
MDSREWLLREKALRNVGKCLFLKENMWRRQEQRGTTERRGGGGGGGDFALTNGAMTNPFVADEVCVVLIFCFKNTSCEV